MSDSDIHGELSLCDPKEAASCINHQQTTAAECEVGLQICKMPTSASDSTSSVASSLVRNDIGYKIQSTMSIHDVVIYQAAQRW